ncbi:hypothetical protein WA158_001848 [Blastocystis sp. Blastoise]
MDKNNIGQFVLGPSLGEGAYGNVILAKKRDTENYVAIKTMKKAFIAREGKIQFVMNEKNALAVMRHPLIIKLYYTFQDKESLYFVEELCRGSLVKMVEYFVEKNEEKGIKDRGCPESIIRFYIAEVLLALEYMHLTSHYIHRDIKPENILLTESGHVKLTDFGTAKYIGPDKMTLNQPSSETSDIPAGKEVPRQRSNTFCGTANYVSPEVLDDKGAYIYSDIWAVGCMIYYMFYGHLLFIGDSDYIIFNKIEEFKVSDLPRENMSKELYSLLCIFLQSKEEDRLLNEPGQSPSYTQIFAHPFFASIDFPSISASPAPFKPKVESLQLIMKNFEDKENDLDINSDDELSASPLSKFLQSNETIVKTSICKLKRGLFTSSRKIHLLLTDLGRVLVIDINTYQVIQEISLSTVLKIAIYSKSKFTIELIPQPNRDNSKLNLSDMEGNANSWVYVLKQYISK